MNTTSPRRKKVVAIAGDTRGRYCVLFKALASLFAIEFCDFTDPETRVDGCVVLDGELATAQLLASRGASVYVVAESPLHPPDNQDCAVSFASSALIDRSLRNQNLTTAEEKEIGGLAVQAGDEVLASYRGLALWLNRPATPGTCEIVSLAPPALEENELLFRHLSGGNFLRLLPLMNFLSRLAHDVDWQAPSVPACFVFDDPSFYWQSYGHLSFRRLAEHAARHNFYVSVATIPLDTWWVSNQVAATFRSASPRLSVLIHGNNHTGREMLQQRDSECCRAVAAQAVRRMDRLQRRHGISYVKIMEAPHGALASDMCSHLLALGYEAALCTTELVVHHNPQHKWPAEFGLRRSETLGGGLPVLPRTRMSPLWKNDVLFKAFLRQPIILAGHHQDAAQGMKLLTEFAELVNSTGVAVWTDLSGVLKSNFLLRREGTVLGVKMFSRQIDVSIPEGVTELRIERPWLEAGSTEPLEIKSDAGINSIHKAGGQVTGITIKGGARIIMTSQFEKSLDCSKVKAPLITPWPVARKILMEIRDRLSPAWPVVGRLCRRADIFN